MSREDEPASGESAGAPLIGLPGRCWGSRWETPWDCRAKA